MLLNNGAERASVDIQVQQPMQVESLGVLSNESRIKYLRLGFIPNRKVRYSTRRYGYQHS